jgi:photosystem II stability/assembly factor-like uncharacterized protein
VKEEEEAVMAERSDTAARLNALKWRCIGPPRGGRVVAVAGDPRDRGVFYFGACAGGIWKTADGGTYWRCVSDGYLGSAAIGALAVAPSDPNVVYAGTGETEIRLDVSYGDGVYKSADAGRTWSHLGLRESRFIGRICIDPHDPDLVYVAALGDVFGENEERGVFRSRDGGTTWRKVLYRDARSGAVDLSMDPRNPRILFAAFWQARRNFWSLSSGGPGSGLFRSTDGGESWTEISRSPGLPGDGPLGKLGVAVSPARAGRVWALVETEPEKTGLYRSDDYGETWALVSSNRDLMHRPWYYTHVFADPRHGETVYVANLQLWKSTDGGSGFTEIQTPHGDNHDLWIDPADSNRMIEGNDGGACVSVNGGETWSSIYNQPTAQFYRIDIDNQYPYRIYGTQQDNTAISVPSATAWGAITLGDCTYPGTGESGFIAVHPDDPNIVYCGAIGSSPGGAGALQRYDHRTRQIQLVNVWPEESTGIAPKDMRYRFAWTFPIVFSPHDTSVLYAAGNHVFRSRDEGMSWEQLSPDLSLNDKSRQGYSGGTTHDGSGAEVHATCASVVPSPHRPEEIWASTDDGLVHVTRDGGKSWQNVTPSGMPELAYVGCVELSPHDPDTIYVAATRYKLADYRPYLFRSTDGGRRFESINGDFPDDQITRVVRADPVRKGLLFAGTETGVYCSLNDGRNWMRLAGGLPVVPVYDLKIKASDLVAATHGRSIWILDDITPLRSLADGEQGPRLYEPRPTVRTKLHFGALRNVRPSGVAFGIASGLGGGIRAFRKPDGTSGREYLDVGENPPNGAIMYYWLSDGVSGPVALTIRDASGTAVAVFRSDDSASAAAKRPPVRPGLNRFVWDLKYPGPETLDASLAPPRNKQLAEPAEPAGGPTVVPGRYRVELSVDSATKAAEFSVVKDPRLSTTPEAYREQFQLVRELTGALGRVNAAVNRIRRAKRRLAVLAGGSDAGARGVAEQAAAVAKQLSTIEAVLVDVHRESDRDVLRNPAGLNDTLVDLINTASVADAAPTKQLAAVSKGVLARVDVEIGNVERLLETEVAAITRRALEAAASGGA